MEASRLTSAWRKAKNHAFTALAGAALLLALVPLVHVTWFVTRKGLPGLSWSFLVNTMTAPDDPLSGIGPAILGTVVLLLLAAAIGVPVGMLSGSWLAEHGRNRRGYAFRLAMDAMAATPSIVVGIFVFTIVVLPQQHFSALAGGLALGFMIVPVVARTTEVALRAVPTPIREASVALGATQTRTLFRVTLPAARAGVVTGTILASARAAGETAPLLFTAFISRYWADSLNKPNAAIPTLVFNYIQQPYEQLQSQAWGAALLLFILVFGANIAVRVASHSRSRAS